ncbi:unnamed protein product [Gongylonema pulchrum]|uniref:ULP_PROTEASE domain-containing protein n=1 Tax=Gongylonema pulchrum TaxID=637853 RepID=A0A183DB39_9BILA|nr:unnamed protein product [Gongylonema pulchrum]
MVASSLLSIKVESDGGSVQIREFGGGGRVIAHVTAKVKDGLPVPHLSLWLDWMLKIFNQQNKPVVWCVDLRNVACPRVDQNVPQKYLLPNTACCAGFVVQLIKYLKDYVTSPDSNTTSFEYPYMTSHDKLVSMQNVVHGVRDGGFSMLRYLMAFDAKTPAELEKIKYAEVQWYKKLRVIRFW